MTVMDREVNNASAGYLTMISSGRASIKASSPSEETGMREFRFEALFSIRSATRLPMPADAATMSKATKGMLRRMIKDQKGELRNGKMQSSPSLFFSDNKGSKVGYREGDYGYWPRIEQKVSMQWSQK